MYVKSLCPIIFLKYLFYIKELFFNKEKQELCPFFQCVFANYL